MTGIVLAGGQSRRLGRDKAVERVGGKTLLERAVDALARVAEEVLVVGRPQERGTRSQEQGVRMRFLEDARRGRGPLGGLYTGLQAATGTYVWAVSCDMPFLDPSLLTQLMEWAPGYDAVVPRRDGQAQTLHAVYSRDCAGVAEALIQKGRPGLHTLLDQIRVRYVEEDTLQPVERWRRSCFSVNTEEDLDLARRWAAAGEE
jgi:molybdopterin-guanine dinucleotide biosynthesis protein A